MREILALLVCICITVGAMPNPDASGGIPEGVRMACKQYMMDLRSSLADEEGVPFDVSASPTSVFCLTDYGERSLRINMQERPQRNSSYCK